MMIYYRIYKDIKMYHQFSINKLKYTKVAAFPLMTFKYKYVLISIHIFGHVAGNTSPTSDWKMLRRTHSFLVFMLHKGTTIIFKDFGNMQKPWNRKASGHLHHVVIVHPSSCMLYVIMRDRLKSNIQNQSSKVWYSHSKCGSRCKNTGLYISCDAAANPLTGHISTHSGWWQVHQTLCVEWVKCPL